MHRVDPAARPAGANPPPAVVAQERGYFDTITRVALRAFSSPLFMMTIGVGLLLTAAALGSVHMISLGIGGLVCFATPLVGFREELYNEVNLVYHAVYDYFKGYPRWSQITDDGFFFIGALPLANYGHLEQLHARGIRSVISVTEVFEGFRIGLFHEPVSLDRWRAAGIHYTHEYVANSAPIPAVTMRRVIQEIDRHVEAGEPVYLHSFVGTRRCAAIAEAYLIHRGICANEADAYAYIHQRHPQADPNAAQRAAIGDALRNGGVQGDCRAQ